MKIFTALNSEKTAASVDIKGDLDADGLDALLRTLALLRADMTPAVCATRDEQIQTDAPVLIEDKPGLLIRARVGGGFRIWLRHRGFGWLGYQIDSLAANTLADYVASFRGAEPGLNLVTHNLTTRH